MVKTLSWKDMARKECKKKNLYQLSNKEKEKICTVVFDRLNKIQVNHDEANKVLEVIRGR